MEIELSAEHVVNSDGGIVGYRGVAHDISERKQKEHQLKQYRENLEIMVDERTAELEQVNKELRDFAYIISHDLRSPLVSITGFAGELKEDISILTTCAEQLLGSIAEDEHVDAKVAINETIPESIHYIENAAEKMNRLINSILTLSRIGRRELNSESVDIKQLVSDNLKGMAFQLEQFNVSVNIGGLPVLQTDAVAMEQVFGNLLGNAVKYLSPERDGLIEVSSEKQGKMIVFHIKDNGVGMEEKDLPHVFELFKRVGNQNIVGEGMGLTYVQTLVRRLGGKIDCKSVLGKGSIFSFSMPENLDKIK